MNDVRLWDVVHPYYCNEGNYFSKSDVCSSHYLRWQDFIDEEGDSDMDMNLLFRWDWRSPREDDDDDNPIQWQGDENYRDCQLLLFYMGQRKGLYRYVIVDVCRVDEPIVKDWLQLRFEHMMRLWSPFSDNILT